MISIKLFATWEAEKSSSNIVPRLCNLSLVQVTLDRPIEPESANTGFFVVVRMRGSARRVLRSPEISFLPTTTAAKSANLNYLNPSAHMTSTCSVPVNAGENIPAGACPNPGVLSWSSTTGAHLTAASPRNTGACGTVGSVPIDFNCSIQYSHMLRRDANIMQILLQRRKMYKSKTMNLGYKTLAYCNVDLAQVLQRRIENRFLDLYTDPNCSTHPVGRVEVQCLSTSPIEKDFITWKQRKDEDDLYHLPDVYSEESDHGEESEEDPLVEPEEVVVHRSRQKKKLAKTISIGQNQLKQKVIGLLRKLKFTDPNEGDLDAAERSKLWDEIDAFATASDIEEDSEGENTDTVSIESAAKPVLRPYFTMTGSSDDTLSRDAGTRLLKRLQRELHITSETETSPERSRHPPKALAAAVGGKPANLSALDRNTASADKRASDTFSWLPRGHQQATQQPQSQHRKQCSLQHPREMAGARLAKHLGHIRRRSKASSVSAEASLKASGAGESNRINQPSGAGPRSANATANREACDTAASASGETGEGYRFAVVESDSSDDQPAFIPSLLVSAEQVSPTKSPGVGSAVARPVSLGDTSSSPAATSTPDARQTRGCSLTNGGEPAVGGGVVLLKAANFSQKLTVGEQLGANSVSPSLTASPHRQQPQPTSAEPKAILNWKDHLLPGSWDHLTGVIFLVNPLDASGKSIGEALSERKLRVLPVASYPVAKQTLARLAQEMQSSSTWRPAAGVRLPGSSLDLIRVCLIGDDSLVHLTLRAYVDQLSSRSADLAAAFRFFPVPSADFLLLARAHHQFDGWQVAGSDTVGRQGSATHYTFIQHLCRLDPLYSCIFSPTTAAAAPPTTSSSSSVAVVLDLIDRLAAYLTNSRATLPFPIGTCVLGTASSNTTSNVVTTSSSSAVASTTSTTSSTLPVCRSEVGGAAAVLADVLPVVSSKSVLPTAVSASTATRMPEEMLVPFLLRVQLVGNDSGQGQGRTVTPNSTHHQQHRTPSGKKISSCFSDPEPLGGGGAGGGLPQQQQQRTISPDYAINSSGLATATSSRSQSTIHSQQGHADHSFWDLLLEYWTAQHQQQTAASLSVTSSALSPGASSDPLSSGQPGRKVTLKATCIGLTVFLAPAPSTGHSAVLSGAISRFGGGDPVAGYRPSTGEVTGGARPPSLAVPNPLCCGAAASGHLLTIAVWSREKKQKIIRIGRRGKQLPYKFEQVEGIHRLLCSGRYVCATSGSSVDRAREWPAAATGTGLSTAPAAANAGSVHCDPREPVGGLEPPPDVGSPGHAAPTPAATAGDHMMRVCIDGVEWSGLKFFQITPTWRTHVKVFPVASLSVGQPCLATSPLGPSPLGTSNEASLSTAH